MLGRDPGQAGGVGGLEALTAQQTRRGSKVSARDGKSWRSPREGPALDMPGEASRTQKAEIQAPATMQLLRPFIQPFRKGGFENALRLATGRGGPQHREVLEQLEREASQASPLAAARGALLQSKFEERESSKRDVAQAPDGHRIEPERQMAPAVGQHASMA